MAIFSAINENTELAEDRQFILSHPMWASQLIAKWLSHLRNCIDWSGLVKVDRIYLLPFSSLVLWSVSRDDDRDYVRHVILPLDIDGICFMLLFIVSIYTFAFIKCSFGNWDNINALITNVNTLFTWINVASAFSKFIFQRYCTFNNLITFKPYFHSTIVCVCLFLIVCVCVCVSLEKCSILRKLLNISDGTDF